MSKSLIIVESPAKARTLNKFLGKNFTVKASMGHVRDLPKSKLGVNIEKNFEPEYITIRTKDKGKLIKELRSAVQKSDKVYLAPDPDREGEAIAWHLAQLLKIPFPERIELHEITRPALKEALKKSHSLNLDKVYAQQARRILDRLVGYKISPLLWKKVSKGLSAGRVQSVSMRLICDREEEINSFVSEEYWSIVADLKKKGFKSSFQATLKEKDKKKVKISNELEAHKILEELKNSSFIVINTNEKEQTRKSPVPFITSSLQQESSRRLGLKVSQTMRIAQQLYEGLDIGKGETVGLITYMRTDSPRISTLASEEAREYILEHYGKNYLPSKPPIFKAKSKAQDAHEGIRPTSVMRTPEEIKPFLDKKQYNLYSLIWKRFIASQMKAAQIKVITVDIEASGYIFKAIGRTIIFPGFLEVYEQGGEDEEIDKVELPKLSKGDKLELIKLIPNQYFTQPPPRYTEATLVKALEEKGIGRPSTYASTIETIQQRGYVMLDKKRLFPTELGTTVTQLLVKHFPDIINEAFTADMENKLDKIEEGDLNWVKLLEEFYTPFVNALQKADNEMEKVELLIEQTDKICDKCGKAMVIKRGRYGPFIACSGFPECKNTQPILKTIGVQCPVDGCQGEIIEKFTRKGKLFFSCSKYPGCKFSSWYKPTNKKCPECNNILIVKRNFLNCINNECKYKITQVEKDL